ncbi:T9SS type A sorting domain-containing protein [bacterium]|nr:T9SS type A sorting domain-containing protein [bacterium]
MKRYKICLIITMLISLHSLYCELDFQHNDMLYNGYGAPILGNNVVKNGNKVLLIDSYGVSIYETDENDLDEIATYEFQMVGAADLNGNNFAVILPNNGGGQYHPDIVKVFDISNLSEPTLIYELESSLYNVFLTEERVILGMDFHVQVYDLNSGDLLHTSQDVALGSNIEDSEFFTINDINEGSFYLCHIDDEGQLVRDQYLGSTYGRTIIHDDTLLYCYGEFIDFYSITDFNTLSFQRTFAMQHLAELELPGLFIFGNTMVAPSYTLSAPYSPQLIYYDISDVNNIIELDNYEFFPELGQSKRMRIHDTIQWNNNFLFVISGFGVMYSNYNNHLDDYTILKYSRGTSISNRSENRLYVNYLNVIGFNNIFDISNINNVTQMTNEDSVGTYFWFQEDDVLYPVKNNLLDGSYEIYTFIDNNLTYLDTFELSDFLRNFQYYLSIILWNGRDLVYSFADNIYWVSYENGTFTDIYTEEVDEIEDTDFTTRWFYYNNFFYKISYQGLLQIYEKQDDSMELVNTMNWAYNNNSSGFVNQWGIKDGLLTIANINSNGVSRIYDLDVDPVNLTAEIELDHYIMNSCVKRYGDYYFFTGSDTENSVPHHFFEQLSYFNIYKKVGDEFIRVGDIYNHRQTVDFEIVPQGQDEFTVFLCSTRGVDVYSCQATPNGDLDITPVNLNAINYPNPFNPETTISYDISKQSQVTVDIYNIKGQKVKRLLKENQEAGQHSIIWKGDNDEGKRVSSGSYFYRVKSGDKEIVNKMMLMK